MVKISIIIPVYKAEKYLVRCLDSLLMQTFKDFEIILINDCSPDNSGLLCDEYAKKDSRIQVIHREKNGGASVTRNLGLEASQGEYIAFVDSDDYVAPEYLEMLFKVVLDTQADIVQCSYQEVIDGKIKQGVKEFFSRIYTKEEAYGLLYGDGRNDIFDFILWNKLYKKSVIDGIRFIEGLRCEDVIYISEAVMLVQKVSVFNQPLYYYCRHDDSVMGQMEKDIKDLIWAHILAYRQVAIRAEKESDYIQTLSNARLAAFYVSAIKNGMLKGNKKLKAMLKEDKRRFALTKNKRIPFIKRVVLMIGG